MVGTVRALFVVPEKKAAALSKDAVEVVDGGFDGDFHTGIAGKRQVLMISAELLSEFQLPPGSLYENMVVAGIDVMALPEGAVLRVGNTTLKVTVPCDPCVQMDRVRPGLRQALERRRGMFARVIEPGTIRVGDAVRVENDRDLFSESA